VNVSAGVITLNYDGARKHRTEIGDDAFIGSDSLLRAPIRVGARSATGAGSVVTKDVPDDMLAVGVPARIRKKTTVSSQGENPLQPPHGLRPAKNPLRPPSPSTQDKD
jgi:bifunctional UDP-N-acetylglucosamine pyrophosphorylase/glucosamine-1-phosphate N-acetyltransferase